MIGEKMSNFDFLAPICSWPPRSTFPKRNGKEIISVWNRSNFHIRLESHLQDLLKCKIRIN